MLVTPREQAGTGIERVHRAGPLRLGGEKREVRPARDAEYFLVAGPGGQRTVAGGSCRGEDQASPRVSWGAFPLPPVSVAGIQ